MYKKPVLLLDIDGVINAVSEKPDTAAWPIEDWVTGQVAITIGGDEEPLPVLYAQPVIDFINDIHEKDLVEIRWHTTWQHNAQKLADLTGLPEFAVADAPEILNHSRWVAGQIMREQPTWWKLPAAERVILDERRPLIWVDDDISFELGKTSVLKMLGSIRPLLAVSPRTVTGLVNKDLLRIEGFLDLLQEQP